METDERDINTLEWRKLLHPTFERLRHAFAATWVFTSTKSRVLRINFLSVLRATSRAMMRTNVKEGCTLRFSCIAQIGASPNYGLREEKKEKGNEEVYDILRKRRWSILGSNESLLRIAMIKIEKKNWSRSRRELDNFDIGSIIKSSDAISFRDSNKRYFIQEYWRLKFK